MTSETSARGLTRSEQSELNDIGWHWDSAYTVGFDGDVYTAARIGYPQHVLAADTTAGLRREIRADYQAWQASLNERSSL
jgi:hypothetical protein